jgi:hypothetical protein
MPYHRCMARSRVRAKRFYAFTRTFTSSKGRRNVLITPGIKRARRRSFSHPGASAGQMISNDTVTVK